MDSRGDNALFALIQTWAGHLGSNWGSARQRYRRWLSMLGGAVLCSCVVIQTGCEFSPEQLTGSQDASQAGQHEDPAAHQSLATDLPAPIDGPSIYVASYNIQVFGQSKLGKPDVMSVLSHVATRFDVMAIQEIRSKEQDVLPRFIEQINQLGVEYDYIIGPRLGGTSSKEQYAFVYDAARIEPIAPEPFTIPDEDDFLHREPFVARFRTRVPEGETPFTFVLINIHTDPDEADEELDSLGEIYKYVCKLYPFEDDIILLGDLNADEYHLGGLGEVPGITYLIGGQATNTAGTATYDNILFLQDRTTEFTGRSGVLPVGNVYQLNPGLAADVSDHLPVWGEFRSREAPAGQMAQQPTGVIR